MRSPLVLLHGFLDSPRTWDLARPSLGAAHDVLAPALAGHLGGPRYAGTAESVVDDVERALDAAGLETAHVAGNSLGGWAALKLAERGRARSVVAFAPAGGSDDPTLIEATLRANERAREGARAALPHLDRMLGTGDGHLPRDLAAALTTAAAGAHGADAMLRSAREHGWPLDPAKVGCPVRIVWGLDDELLPWPAAAAAYRRWFPTADWVELDGVGHAPQLEVPLEAAQLILGWAG